MGTGAEDMSTPQQPEALWLADELDADFAQWRISNHTGRKAEAELRRLHARIAELESQLESIGAGGVSGPLMGCASIAASAGSEPVAPAGAAVLCWVNEDELPEGLTQEAYSALFHHSKVDGVRMFPIFGLTAQAAPAGAGTWAHLKLMMEESAWDGTLQLSDALANIDDLAAAHPSPPEGMVGEWIASKDQIPPRTCRRT